MRKKVIQTEVNVVQSSDCEVEADDFKEILGRWKGYFKEVVERSGIPLESKKKILKDIKIT